MLRLWPLRQALTTTGSLRLAPSKQKALCGAFVFAFDFSVGRTRINEKERYILNIAHDTN